MNPLIDGTVEGTNIQIIDNNSTHDHTYYGNGCPNQWDSQNPDGRGGSPVSCETDMINTIDNETLKIGTYYSVQAATGSTGYSYDDPDTLIPDTFCPLGWQLPYSGTGGDYYDKSKSWRYLFATYNIAEYTQANNFKIRSYPFSYTLAGRYEWNYGRLFELTRIGGYWSDTRVHLALLLYTYTFNVANGFSPVAGLPVRCVNYFSIPHRRHGGRKSSEYDDSALSG